VPSLVAVLVASAIYFGILLLTKSLPAEIAEAFTSLRSRP
jgi:hypothetical protein